MTNFMQVRVTCIQMAFLRPRCVATVEAGQSRFHRRYSTCSYLERRIDQLSAMHRNNIARTPVIVLQTTRLIQSSGGTRSRKGREEKAWEEPPALYFLRASSSPNAPAS